MNIFHKSVLQEGIRKLEQPKTAGIGNEGAIAPCEYYSHGAMAQGNAFHIVCCQSKNTSAKGRETGLTFILVRVGGIGDKNLAAPQPFSWEPDLGRGGNRLFSEEMLQPTGYPRANHGPKLRMM